MSRTSTGFGTRQGGLAQPYRSNAAARPQGSAPQPKPDLTPPMKASELWQDPREASPFGASPTDVYSLNNPVFMRFVSAAIDLVILFLLTMLTMFIFDALDGGMTGGSNPKLLEDSGVTLAVAALWFGYGILFEGSALQGTPGKILTGLVVTDMSGQRMGFGKTFGRACGKVFSTIVPFYIPYIMVGITERKQSLHDKMCGTLVFRRRDLANSNAVFD